MDRFKNVLKLKNNLKLTLGLFYFLSMYLKTRNLCVDYK
jgi:hypothetical protein